MSSYSYDDTCWPILVVTPPARGVDDAELRLHLRRMSGYARRGAYAVVVDCSAAPPLSLRQTTLLAQALADDEQQWPGALLGRAVVSPRGPFHHVDDAFAWCLERVAARARRAA